MTLVFLVSGVLRRISSISKPLIFGIIMSLIIKSGFSLTAIANASSPSFADTTSYPSARSRAPYISKRFVSSSTSIIFAM